MKILPNQTKFRKVQKGKIGRVETRVVDLKFGSYGLQGLERARFSGRQIESFRLTLARRTNKVAQIWFRVFPHKPFTGKPLEVRMGKGKGLVDYWAAEIKPGRILVELDGVSENVALEALKSAKAKLPFKTRIVIRAKGD
jgi:large subunit ribosomal protein L16